MKGTKLLYRLSGQNSSILNRCPKTQAEVDKIKDVRERWSWSRLAGVSDEDMRAFQKNKEKCIKKLREVENNEQQTKSEV